MKIFDISIPISPTLVVWPGDPNMTIRKLSEIKKGDDANVSEISMSVHTGTHIDSPKHFIDNGKTIEQIPLEKLVGNVLVMAFEDETKVINKQALENHPKFESLLGVKKVLFKTSNSSHLLLKQENFSEEFVGIDKSGAKFLANLNLDLIGVDYLSVASFRETDEPHQILLQNEIVLLEGINLHEVPPGDYKLYCLPLLILGSDGAPARTILIMENEEIR
jgi:arylformamidase